MARELEIPLFEVLSDRNRFLRYVICIGATIAHLWNQKPSVVICQNPSIALTFFLLCIRHFFGFKLGIDAHFGGIDATNGSKAPQCVLDWCNRSADLVIVTNERHSFYVRNLGGKVFICPDPLPDLSRYSDGVVLISKKIFVICSYDVDEPFREVFKAAKELVEEGFCFTVSGKYQKAGISPQEFPYVDLLGFVAEDDFYRQLFSSQVIVDLTDNDDCLVCGAYEALAAYKPLVLSRKIALQSYFTGGTVFTENNASDIANAVRFAFAERERLMEEAYQWVLHSKEEINSRMLELTKILENI
jgi:glycosyltransferase involved in cell wall biosynthesis